jgi:hypothetical protein
MRNDVCGVQALRLTFDANSEMGLLAVTATPFIAIKGARHNTAVLIAD